MATTITSDAADGTHTEITLDKTDKDKGTITVKQWKKGKDPKKDKPDKDDTTELYKIKANKDGTKVTCKASAPNFTSNPEVTITVNCPELPNNEKKKPSVTVTIKGTSFAQGDGTTTYDISEADQDKLKKFVTDSGFPLLALAGNLVGGALAALMQPAPLLSAAAVDRLGFTVAETAVSLLSRGDDWIERDGKVVFIGFDPGVSAQFSLEGTESDASLVLTVRISEKALHAPATRFRDAFLHPSRSETIDYLGEVVAPIEE